MRQSLVVVAAEDKREALRRLIASEEVKNALIFCNRKRDVDILQRSLTRHGLDAAALHGDMPQPKRTETLERFKNGEIRLLVASDVAARGLDIEGLSHVFNFDVPYHAEDYIHRIGRTGRAGRPGRSLTLAAPEDGKAVAAIQQLIGKAIPLERMADIAPAELDFTGGDRRRGRRAPTPRAAPERARARPAQRGNGPLKLATMASLRDHLDQPAGNARGARLRCRPSRDRRPPHRPSRCSAQPAAPPRQPAPAERRVVGFGDDLPAFLARAPRVAARA